MQGSKVAGVLGPEAVGRALPEAGGDGLDRQLQRRVLGLSLAQDRWLDFARSIGGVGRHYMLAHVSAVQIMRGLVGRNHLLLS